MKAVNYVVKTLVVLLGTCIVPYMFPLMILLHGNHISEEIAGGIYLVFLAAGIYMMIKKKPLDIFAGFDQKGTMGKIMVVVMELAIMMGIGCVYESMGIPLE